MDVNKESFFDLFNIVNKNIVIYEVINGEEFVFKDFNKFAEKTENIKKEDIIGKNVKEVFPNAEKFGIIDVFKRVYRTGISENFPLRMYEDSRISGWRDNYIYKLKTGEILAIYDDLTKVKQLEESLIESEEQFRSFFENNKAVILKINSENQRIEDCNKAALQYYGYTKKELTSKTIDELNTLSIDEIKKKMKKALREKANFFNFKHKLKNGEVRNVELYASPIKVKDKIYLFSIIQDVTDRIKSQNAIIENQRLVAVGEMAASVAHDFNNSLQVIIGNIELCVYNEENLGYHGLINKLKIIESNIKETSTRVRSLLNFSSNKNTIEKEIIKLNDILENIIFQSKPLWKTEANKNGIKIEIIKNYKDDFYIYGNKGLLSSALFNMIKNSIEAMPDGGEIIFRIEKVKNKIHLFIKDTGIGMSKETQIRIFQPFFSTKGLEIGRGLGMSGVYTIINEHRGVIKIKDSEVNKGTTIEIILPSENKKENDKENNIGNINKKELKILWVDDNEIITLLAKKYINAIGHSGDSVISGKDALSLLKKNKYDVLITDIGMPEMNGWQLIDKIRNELKNTKIKIIILSGWEIKNDKRLNEYNISDILQKPVTINNLKAILN